MIAGEIVPAQPGGEVRVPARHRRRAGKWTRAVVAAVAAAVVVLLAPAPAGAHAELDSTEPEAGAQLDAAPERLVLRFTEGVEVPDDAVDLYDGAGDVIDGATAAHLGGERAAVVVDMPALEDGAYVVAWQVISSDSHPITGAFTFGVGDVSATDAESVMGDVAAESGAGGLLGAVYAVDRFVAFAGVILLVGGAAFLLTLWPAGLADRRARRLVAVAWWATALATVASIGLQAAYGTGGTLADALDPSLIGDELGRRTGRVWVVRLVLLAVAAGLASRLGPRPRTRAAAGDVSPGRRPADEWMYVTGLVGLGVLVTVSLAGHAASGDLVALALAVDVVHLAAVSTWLGGIAMLAGVALRRDAGVDTGVLGPVVTRFSTVAFVAVVAVVASGVVQSWRQLGGFDALFDTTYGRLLVVKVALVGLLLVGAAFSRSWVRSRRPAPKARGSVGVGASPGPGTAAARAVDVHHLQRSVGTEALIAVAVLAVTAGLVNAVPGETAVAGGPVAVAEPVDATLHGDEVLVEASVAPVETGPVDVELRILTHGGDPVGPEEVTASLSLPERDLGPLDVALEETDVGRYVGADVQVPFAGTWELEVVVRTSDIDQDRLSTTFTIR